jgi:hypothetical protein
VIMGRRIPLSRHPCYVLGTCSTAPMLRELWPRPGQPGPEEPALVSSGVRGTKAFRRNVVTVDPQLARQLNSPDKTAVGLHATSSGHFARVDDALEALNVRRY